MFDASLDGRKKKVIQNCSMRVPVPGVDQWSFEALVYLWFTRAKRQPPRQMGDEMHRQNWAKLHFGHYWKCTKTHLSTVFHQQRYAPLPAHILFDLASTSY